MRKMFFIGMFISCTTFVYAGPYDWSLGFTGDTRTVTISTNPASPTQLFTKDSNVQCSYIINPSTFAISISSNNVTISTNTAFKIPGMGALAADPVVWSPDGVNAPYNGALYAVGAPTSSTPPSISIFRSK